jgi:hypothetical protein
MHDSQSIQRARISKLKCKLKGGQYFDRMVGHNVIAAANNSIPTVSRKCHRRDDSISVAARDSVSAHLQGRERTSTKANTAW